MAGDEQAIGRNRVAWLQENVIADDQIVDRDFGQMAVAEYLDQDHRGFFQQFLERLLVAVFRPGGDEGGDHHRKSDADAFVPFGIPEDRQQDRDQ